MMKHIVTFAGFFCALIAEAAEIPIRPHTTSYALADANRALIDLKEDAVNGTGVLVMD